jgi:hypothetical protein
MKRVAWVLVLGLVPGLALARRPERSEYARDSAVERADQRGDRAERREKRERIRKEMQLRRIITLADELGLTEAETLRIREVLAAGDERKQALGKQLRGHIKALKEMAQGSPTADEVNAQLVLISELRRQMQVEEERQLQEASAGLSPARKAQMALILGLHDRRVQAQMLKVRSEGSGTAAGEGGAELLDADF